MSDVCWKEQKCPNTIWLINFNLEIDSFKYEYNSFRRLNSISPYFEMTVALLTIHGICDAQRDT